ncbi:MAG: hypothetical protein KC427_07700 [Sulfurovum sp.]|uniref:hypothetical protein n=1 Tax=Sulfurovum sp. TaxID=1969726 RepID=UPI002867C9E5|nr:hypothetical protein [Sulfurovum sp.]MCO4845884.1 hypothetical protein [Sulfurovum sp.]
MKQTLLITISSLVMATFMTACTSQVADSMASVGNSNLTSNPCPAIDKKIMRLDRFTEVVKNTSAFHLEEKATAIPTPGITVSNNRKQMLRDADKKYAEYTVERQKYGCETPMTAGTAQMEVASKPTLSSDPSADNMVVSDSPVWSSDSCAAIDKKLMKLNEFTTMVNNTSAFHLEEKASALPVPGITASNNKKKMLRDANKKYAEYEAEREKYGCDTPIPMATVQRADKREVESKSAPSVPSIQDAAIEEKPTALPVPEVKTSNNKEQIVDEKKKDAEVAAERQKDAAQTSMTTSTAQRPDKKSVVSKPIMSSNLSDSCAAIDKKLIKLYEFTIMVNNTSAFHLEEKASALPVPGITASNNKKKMLRDAEKKGVELLAEREKYGCETAED